MVIIRLQTCSAQTNGVVLSICVIELVNTLARSSAVPKVTSDFLWPRQSLMHMSRDKITPTQMLLTGWRCFYKTAHGKVVHLDDHCENRAGPYPRGWRHAKPSKNEFQDFHGWIKSHRVCHKCARRSGHLARHSDNYGPLTCSA